MSKKFLAMDIGCIECGEDSEVIGIFDTEEPAKKAIEEWTDDSMWGKEGRHGQHYEEIFEVEL